MSGQEVSASPVLRPATRADLPGIERLLTESDLPLDGVQTALDHFTVAEYDGAIVGVVGLEMPCSRYALLRSTAVAPEWRSRKVGRALVERAIAVAEARGCAAMYLLTTTAERYFPSFGFVPTSRDAVPAEVQQTTEFASVCPSTATAMKRELRGDTRPAREA